ncbi:MAG TPA: FAD-dependent oxidoreductase [Micromonosporaceae bacterium]
MAGTTGDRRVVIVGGGYTGMMCAIRLARRTRRHGVEVVLVNPSDRFTERLRMHQIATGQTLSDRRIPALLEGTGVQFVQGRASRIDPDQRDVWVDTDRGPRVLRYHTLVYAIGSVADSRTVPGVETHAYTLDDPHAATRLANRLAELDGGTVAVCGGGLTGVESAAEIADSHPRVRVLLLTRDEPGSMMGDRARGYLRRSLARLGVEVRAGVEVVKVLPGAPQPTDGQPVVLELADGESVPVDACLWTTGFVASPLAERSGLAVDPRGRVVVDETLASVSHPSVYAIGDAAAVRQPWGEIHGTCQSGIPMAIHAADTIARRLRDRPAKPFRFGYVHQPVSLGRHDAVIQFTRPDDSPRRWYLTGRAAVAYKEAVSSSPPWAYRLSARVTVPAAFVALRGGRATRRPVSAAAGR